MHFFTIIGWLCDVCNDELVTVVPVPLYDVPFPKTPIVSGVSLSMWMHELAHNALRPKSVCKNSRYGGQVVYACGTQRHHDNSQDRLVVQIVLERRSGGQSTKCYKIVLAIMMTAMVLRGWHRRSLSLWWIAEPGRIGLAVIEKLGFEPAARWPTHYASYPITTDDGTYAWCIVESFRPRVFSSRLFLRSSSRSPG